MWPDHGDYRAPVWLPGGHAQTIYPVFVAVAATPLYRERWATPDGDFIDLDWSPPSAGGHSATPRVVLFHGLEGSSQSHYARALAVAARTAGWQLVVPHFRGCSGTPNRLPRAYRSGDSAEIDWIVRRLKATQPAAPLFAAGISLGGNALAKWLGEQGAAAESLIEAAAVICAPLDLAISGHALARGPNRLYTHHFLRTMKRRVRHKLAQWPELVSRAALDRARTLHDFDDLYTAPVHGFRNADDYWRRASCRPLLAGIRVPTWLLNPANDPFVPSAAWPTHRELAPSIEFETPAQGGHVGFPTGLPPGRIDWLPARMLQFFSRYVSPHIASLHVAPLRCNTRMR